MANARICDKCRNGSSKDCVGRFQAPSNRTELSKGTLPRRPQYSYKCPNLKVET